MRDIYTAIREEHDRHRELLKALSETSGDTEERRDLFAKLKEDVTAHANAEEQTFYAALLKEPDSQEKARHSISEHAEAEDIIEELAQMEMSSPGWLTRFKSLREELEHHMDEEEKEVFAKARKILSDKDAARLGARFAERKEDELEEAG